MTVEELNQILDNLNISATFYESYVIRSVDKENFSYSVFLEYVGQETIRLGESLSNQILEYIFAMIWCYANTPVNEGDVVAIDPKKWASKGVEMINHNPNLIGMYVFPLFLYGAEYYSTAHYMFSGEPPHIEEPGCESKTFHLESFLSSVLETGIQARYRHILQCHLDNETGTGELFSQDFSGVPLPTGNLVQPVEE